MRKLSYNSKVYRLSVIFTFCAVIMVILTSAYNIEATRTVVANIDIVNNIISETVRGNNNDISESNKNISGNFNTIRGDGNMISGNNNTIYGDNNIINGNFNKVHGENNRIRGNNNRFTPDAGNTVTGNFNREHE